jgi:hypothetical protein
VAGGRGADVHQRQLDSTELFSENDLTTRLAAYKMPRTLIAPRAVSLPDGRLWLSGGRDSSGGGSTRQEVGGPGGLLLTSWSSCRGRGAGARCCIEISEMGI